MAKLMTTAERMSQNRVLTPLWIIALFVSLTEIVLGVAVTQTNSGIQIALTLFVIIFPLLIAGGFFVILWSRPYVLYHPTEFGGQVDVQQYVEAIQRRSLSENQLDTKIHEIIRSTLSSTEVVTELTERISHGNDKNAEVEVAKVLVTVGERAIERIRQAGFITIDSRPLVGTNGNIRREPYDIYPTVTDFLNDIYFALDDAVPPYTYEKTWILRNSETKYVYSGIGNKVNQLHRDDRTLEEIGIVPGMTLEVIPPYRVNRIK